MSTPDDGLAREGSDPLLEVQNLRKTYGEGDSAVTAVDDVSFSIDQGNIVGLLGHNGAGKTTTIKMILGLISPTAGDVFVADVDVQKHPYEAYDHMAAVLEGARNIYWRLTIRENLEFFARLGGLDPSDHRDRHDQLLEHFDLLDRADTVVNELSKGMKQKVCLAAILAREPDLLFLDEPTLGLDVESSHTLCREIRRLVETENMTVVVSSHDMDVVEDICDRVIILTDGHVTADDSIENLHRIFESHELRVAVEGDVPADFRSTLESTYRVSSWEERRDRVELSVSVTEDSDIHRVVGAILDAGLRIADIQTTQIDLEEIYLSVTESGDDPDDGTTAVPTEGSQADV